VRATSHVFGGRRVTCVRERSAAPGAQGLQLASSPGPWTVVAMLLYERGGPIADLRPMAVLISSHRLTIQPPYSATRCCPQMFGSSVRVL